MRLAGLLRVATAVALLAAWTWPVGAVAAGESCEAKSATPGSWQPTGEARTVWERALTIRQGLGGVPGAEAVAALADLEASISGLARPVDRARTWLHVGRSYEMLDSLEGIPGARVRAAAAFEAAERAAKAAGDSRLASFAAGYRGEIYAAAGRNEEAIRLLRSASFSAQLADAPESLYRWQWQLGRLARAAGDQDAALRAYRQAVGTLADLRDYVAFGGDEARVDFRERFEPVYVELVDVLLLRARTAPEPEARQSLLVEARNVLETLKAAELRDYLGSACLANVETSQVDLDRVAGKAAVVYPILLPDRLELLVTLAGGLQQFTVPVPEAQLRRELTRFRYLLEKRTTHEYRRHAQVLFDWLVAPYEAALQTAKVDTLVLVPDGPLRTIPLGALHDGKRFLVERYALAVVPGLRLVDPKGLDLKRSRLLLAGLSEPVQGFAALDYVPEELKGLHDLYGGQVLLNDAFSSAALAEGVEELEPSVLHLASHAEFTGDPATSFLLTYDQRMSLTRMGDLMRSPRDRDGSLELLVLSACSTASGDERSGLGLAGVGIRAGARSALGTLWPVSDEGTYDLMMNFYRGLGLPEVSKAVALAEAQRGLIAKRSYRHPYYWAPFLLISNWL